MKNFISTARKSITRWWHRLWHPNQFTPELGQFCGGQPWKQVKAPDYILGALLLIAAKVGREHEQNPFFNNGGSVETDVFHCEAYSWDDNYEQPYNFKWRDVEISWYKHCQRGVSMNRKVSERKLGQMLHECLKSIKTEEN